MSGIMHYASEDVDKDLARQAHSGTSMVPGERAEREVAEYVAHMAAVAEEFTAWLTEDNAGDLTADLEDYRQRYVTKLHALWHAKSRCMSTMITGGSGWTSAMVRRNEKRNATERKRCSELLDWSKRRLEKLRNTYDPRRIAAAPIASDDPDAIAKLQAKIDKAVRLQDMMKAANRICRKNGLTEEERIAKLEALGLQRETAENILTPDPYIGGKPGFAPFQLSNNNGRIKRMKERVARLQSEAQHREATPEEERETTILGVEVVVYENYADDRLQLFFEGKPPEQVRTLLKSHGFHWSRREMAWQRLLNDNARRALKYLEELES